MMTSTVEPLQVSTPSQTCGRPWTATAARAQLRRTAARAGVRRRFAPHQLRHAHAVEMAREQVPLVVIQRTARPRQPGHHLDLPAGHRQKRDHRHRPRTPSTHDPRPAQDYAPCPDGPSTPPSKPREQCPNGRKRQQLDRVEPARVGGCCFSSSRALRPWCCAGLSSPSHSHESRHPSPRNIRGGVAPV